MRTSSATRLLLAPLAFVLALSLALTACDSSDSPTADGTAQAPTSQVTPSTGPPQSFGVFTGAIVVRTVDAQRVVVSLDADSPDGVIDRIFTLQTDTDLAEPLDFEADRATLRLAHGNLFVDAPSRKRGLHLQTGGFALDNEEGRKALRQAGAAVALDDLDADRPRRLVVGVGLAQHVVDASEGVTLDQARAASAYLPVGTSSCALSLPFKTLDGGSLGRAQNCSTGCSSGGPGSESCGDGDCNVSCSGGYYSCCDGATCTCCRA